VSQISCVGRGEAATWEDKLAKCKEECTSDSKKKKSSKCKVCLSYTDDLKEEKEKVAPDKSWLFFTEEKFLSMGEGVRDGKGWCMSPSSRCYSGIRKRLKSRYGEYKEYFEKYSGGVLPAHLALTSCTEAPAGPLQCSPDKKLKECGIMGLKMIDAKECDIDPFSPEASIWCAARNGNQRILDFEKRYPQVKLAPRSQRYMLSVASGGVGEMWINAIEHSQALAVKNGKLVYTHPFDRVLEWLSKPKKPSSFLEKVTQGRVSSYRLGLRAGRHVAVMLIIAEFYGVKNLDDLPYKDPIIIPRPSHFPRFSYKVYKN